MFLQLTLLQSLLLLAASKPYPHPRSPVTVFESLPQIPSGFVNSGVAPATHKLTLRVGLKQSNISGLEAVLYQVSDPASPHYRQYLTREQAAEFVQPTNETLDAVSKWLATQKITANPVTPAGDIVEMTIPVSSANTLLHADFQAFTHVESGTTSIRTLAYSIPAELQEHIEFVHPTVSFIPPLQGGPKLSSVSAQRRADAAPLVAGTPSPSCNTIITPECLQAMYAIPTAPATQSSNKLGVTGFLQEFANQLDLQQFLASFRRDMASSTTFSLQTLDGGVNDQTRSEAGIEANLDIQYTVGLATNVPINFISVGSDTHDGLSGFIDIITFFLQSDPANRPSVLSTSYGFDERQVPQGLANNLCNQYMQLGALGTSIIFSSGDGGVAGSREQICVSYIPTFPSTCPYVTSVGSTRGINEVAAEFSSGGFSNFFDTPSYQSADVASYLSSVPGGLLQRFNRNGRGFPDVAAQGENFEVSSAQLVFGTSASGPVFASIIALLNDELLAAGKSPLGFLNPLLYSTSGRAALNDVTSGNNPGCLTNGFSAKSGWDPVTGLGSPNYERLRAAVGL